MGGARHRDRRHAQGVPAPRRQTTRSSSRIPANKEDGLSSRVVRTYDFLRIKNLLDPDPEANTTGDRHADHGHRAGRSEDSCARSCAAACCAAARSTGTCSSRCCAISHVKKHYHPPRVRFARDARRRHPGGQLAGGAGRDAADRAAARRLSRARALRPARAARRSAGHRRRVHDHRRAAVHPCT